MKIWIGPRWACQISVVGTLTTIVPSRTLPDPVNRRSRRPLAGGVADALGVDVVVAEAPLGVVLVSLGAVAGAFPGALMPGATCLAVTVDPVLGAAAVLGTVTETVEPLPPPPPQPASRPTARAIRIAPAAPGRLL